MLLLRISCTSDWKGRPTHGVVLLHKGTRDECIAAREKDVRELYIEELVTDLRIGLENDNEPDDIVEKRCDKYKDQLTNLFDTERLRKAWEWSSRSAVDDADHKGVLDVGIEELETSRWEMDRPGQDAAEQRVFAWNNGEGDLASVSYNIVEEEVVVGG
jgi:hypothetical protein